jgi:hypothetical protein
VIPMMQGVPGWTLRVAAATTELVEKRIAAFSVSGTGDPLVSVRRTHFVSYSVPGAVVAIERLVSSAITRSIIFGSHC